MNRLIVLFLLIFSYPVLQAQGAPASGTEPDSLTLQEIIHEVTLNHPAVKAAEEAIRKSEARISLARTGYLPEVDASASYANIGPVPVLTFEPLGTFQLFPRNNYTAAVNLHETLYDFGRTAKNVAAATEGKAIGETALEDVRQKMAQASIATFYSLYFLQEAVRIKNDELKVLDEHLAFVQKKKETGSATDYEILATQVKISGVESQLLDLESAIKVGQSNLNNLLGRPVEAPVAVSGILDTSAETVQIDTLFSSALANRNEMVIGRKKENLATLQYQAMKTVNKPAISFMLSGGAKNGFVPDINKIRPNYSVGAGIRVPIFDANRNKYNLMQAESSIRSARIDIEQTTRKITGEIVESETNLQNALRKIQLFEMQVGQARKAYSLADVNFRAGAITNLDLLDAGNAVSDSELMLMKARIDYEVAHYRLMAAIGRKLY
jgi:outer membrane protein